MDVMYFFVGAAVVGAVVAGLVFLWALRTGQFDDLEGPAYRILYDEDDPMLPSNRKRAEAAQSRRASPPDQDKSADSGS